MNWLRSIGWKQGSLWLIFFLILVFGTLQLFADTPEVALTPGEPWEDMRKRSSAKIDPAIPGSYWGRVITSDARLRLIDPQYGFVTPRARFFTVSFNNERVNNIRMSPQIEPLLLDDTLKIVLDLQEQWRKAGWIPIWTDKKPLFADTPEWRARLRDANRGGSTFWRAGDKYQVMLIVGRFTDDSRPTEERYLITLQLAKPWGDP